MDLERTMQFVLDRQAKAEAEMEQLRSVAANLFELHDRLSSQISNLARIVREIAEENQQAHLRYEEAHRQYEEAHRRFEELHEENEARFNALIQMMDDWIRERRKNNGSP